MQFEKWVTVNLDRGRAESIDLGPVFFTDDVNPMKLGVRLISGGSGTDVTGTVSGWAVLPDDSTILDFDAGKSGNEAWIIVPQRALSQRGRIEIFLRIAGEEGSAVSLYATAYVRRSQTPNWYVPGDPLPDIGQIRQYIAGAEAILDGAGISAQVSGTTLVITTITT